MMSGKPIAAESHTKDSNQFVCQTSDKDGCKLTNSLRNGSNASKKE